MSWEKELAKQTKQDKKIISQGIDLGTHAHPMCSMYFI